jgi:hypothetical protein
VLAFMHSVSLAPFLYSTLSSEYLAPFAVILIVIGDTSVTLP